MKKTLLLVLLIIIATSYFIGTKLISSSPFVVGEIPKELPNTKEVHFKSKNGATLSGWLVKAKHPKGGILLLHALRSNRLQMLHRAEFLQREGYTVLLFDFQAHGESSGEHITFGHLESLDVESAYDYLEKVLGEPNIGIIGISLGGASALLSNVKKRAKAIVLESVYPTLEEAIEDRLKIYLGSMGRYLSPLLTWQLQPRLGFGVDDLKPIEELSKVKGAVLLIAGEKDKHTTLQESKMMFKQLHEPKELWIVSNAKHVDFDALLGEEYKERVLRFFNSKIAIEKYKRGVQNKNNI